MSSKSKQKQYNFKEKKELMNQLDISFETDCLVMLILILARSNYKAGTLPG